MKDAENIDSVFKILTKNQVKFYFQPKRCNVNFHNFLTQNVYRKMRLVFRSILIYIVYTYIIVSIFI